MTVQQTVTNHTVHYPYMETCSVPAVRMDLQEAVVKKDAPLIALRVVRLTENA